MKKIIFFVIGLILLSMIQSASAIWVGGMNGYTKAVHYDDANMTKIEFTGVLITRSNLDDYNNLDDFEVLIRDFWGSSVKHVCEWTSLSAEEKLFLTGGSLMQIDGECVINSSIVPKPGRYDMEWSFPSDASLEFSLEGDSTVDDSFIEITPIEIDTDQGDFEYIRHDISSVNDGLLLRLILDTDQEISADSLTYEINTTFSDNDCEGIVTEVSEGYLISCVFPDYDRLEDNINHSFFIKLENPWDNNTVIDYSFTSRVNLVENVALEEEIANNKVLQKVLDDLNADEEDDDNNQESSCIWNVVINSLTISHSWINLQTSARLQDALENFYDTVETRFETYDKQLDLYNEILDRIDFIEETRDNSQSAKNIISVLKTNIGYRIEEQKDIFSCKNDGIDFESLLDLNLD